MIICPVCKFHDTTRLKSLTSDIDRYRCNQCSSLFAIHDIINPHVYLHENSESYHFHYALSDKVRANIEDGNIHLNTLLYSKSFKYNFVLSQIKNSDKHLRILEVGCSTGHFVAHLRSLGYEAYGCDIASSAIEYAIQNHGSYYYDLKSFDEVKHNYNTICFMGTIGCVDDPIAFIDSFVRKTRADNLTIIFNAPNSSFVEKSLFLWPNTYPPDLNILFNSSFWENHLKSTYQINHFYQRKLKASSRFLFKCMLSSIKFGDYTSALLYLLFFLNPYLEVYHPYGILINSSIDLKGNNISKTCLA